MRNQQIADVLDAWIADKRLARRKLAFLKSVYTQQHHALLSAEETQFLDIADSLYCEELDLPPGSPVVAVVAALLDHLEPWEPIYEMGPDRQPYTTSRLQEIQSFNWWPSDLRGHLGLRHQDS
jgi:hypothetical protein